tara:strand:- start:7463 stop:7657 length:195 start_codon:yes stop_codon:yes gene_type:complete
VAKITSIIIAMVGMVIGANLIAPINTATSVITTATYTAAVTSLSALLPLLFVVVLMIFAVRAIE